MGFSQIVGHQKQVEALRLALASARLHHAYLFVGAEGVGKKTIALGLAKAIHCSGAVGDFCGECADCARIQDGNHPDVRIIEILAGKKEISIQQIRELEKELNFRSFSGKKKIVVLDPATLMNVSAQNALLKTLEEPPKNSLLFLVAPNVGGLLPTLRSRCFQVSFGSLPRDLVANFLITRRGLKTEEAEFLAAITLGSLGAATKIDKKNFLEKRQHWLALLTSLNKANYRGAIEAAEELASNKDALLEFLEWAVGWQRDRLVYTVTQDSREIVNLDLISEIQQQTAQRDLESILSLLSQTAGAVGSIQRNLNRRMVLENVLLNIVGER
jgi:DNA polymerase III subunit delta'